MFPLKQRILIRGAAAHVKAGLGIAADYEAVYINDYVPFDGRLDMYWGTEGGNWCRLTRPNGDRIEMAHHSKFLLKGGPVKEGQLMAVTGNTGSITTRPHLHIQIFNKAGQRLDPEKYDWGKGKYMIQLIRDKGTVYLVAGMNKKVKTGIADQAIIDTLFGDEPITDGDTSGIKQSQTASSGFIIHKT